jgi:hypothetical protein
VHQWRPHRYGMKGPDGTACRCLNVPTGHLQHQIRWQHALKRRLGTCGDNGGSNTAGAGLLTDDLSPLTLSSVVRVFLHRSTRVDSFFFFFFADGPENRRRHLEIAARNKKTESSRTGVAKRGVSEPPPNRPSL